MDAELLRQAMRKIRDAHDASGGAKLPVMMLEQAKRWEQRGYIELHHGDAPGVTIARITPRGRAVADAKIRPHMADE